MLRERYLHPNGQMPAYEWNFGDVNPPVHAWATMFTYRLNRRNAGNGDIDLLESVVPQTAAQFHLVGEPQGPHGSNVFEGGFLGLDNIGVFDRSAPLPTGGYLEQADGTAWMAFFCQNMLEIAVELALHEPAYEEMALKFVEHFLWIAGGDDRTPATARACGTRRTASSTTCCGCRTARAAPQGAVDGRPAAAVRGHGLRRRAARAATRELGAAHPAVPRGAARSCATIHDPARPASRARGSSR